MGSLLQRGTDKGRGPLYISCSRQALSYPLKLLEYAAIPEGLCPSQVVDWPAWTVSYRRGQWGHLYSLTKASCYIQKYQDVGNPKPVMAVQSGQGVRSPSMGRERLSSHSSKQQLSSCCSHHVLYKVLTVKEVCTTPLSSKPDHV